VNNKELSLNNRFTIFMNTEHYISNHATWPVRHFRSCIFVVVQVGGERRR